MKLITTVVFLLTFMLLGTFSEIRASEPCRLIFDTDIGNDIDDALALSVIHALESRGECKLLAVTISKNNPLAARYANAINAFYGRDEIPIGLVRNGKTPKPGRFLPLAEVKDNGKLRYPHRLSNVKEIPDATDVLRKALVSQPDGSVSIAVVGFSTNISRLLDSKADSISPLTGKELVRKKVKLLSMMAGNFAKNRPAKFKEYNVIQDLEAARNLFDNWPTPIVSSGWEVGHAIKYPAVSIQQDFNYVKHHPCKEGYELYQKMPYDRPTWDLTSVLYAIRPSRNYFGFSQPGKFSIGPKDFALHTPKENGAHRFFTVNAEQIAKVKEALVILASEPPHGK